MTPRQYGFHCHDCFGKEIEECICDKIVGYDADTEYAIVSITDEEWSYIHSGTTCKKKNEPDKIS